MDRVQQQASESFFGALAQIDPALQLLIIVLLAILASALFAIVKLWGRNNILQDRQVETAVGFTQSVNDQTNVMNRAIDAIEKQRSVAAHG